MTSKEILSLINEEFNSVILSSKEASGELSLDIRCSYINRLVCFLCVDSRLKFSLFVDIAGVDYSAYKCRDDSIVEDFAVIYIFYSFEHDKRIKLRSFVSSDVMETSSIYPYYKGALLTEREVYDMYGIVFKGHPNLKRLLMPDDYEYHPLRKDYPLQGKGERTLFPKNNIYDRIKED